MDYKGYEIKILQDTEIGDPRDEFDHFGTMVCWHKSYKLGDKHEYRCPGDFESDTSIGADATILPLFLYDHSGLTISTSPFSCPWDSGQIGYIFAKKEDIDKEFNGDVAAATECLKSEVTEYDQYLREDVWGYVITDPDGNEIDSCWGMYGYDYCEKTAKEIVDQESAL